MKKVPSPKGITNGGKIRSSSVPSSQSPSMHHVLTDLALYIHQGYPPTCPPAPQTPTMNHGREKHRPFSHQMTRLNISSETSESNRDWYGFFFLSLSLWDAHSPRYFTSPFLAPHFSTKKKELSKKLLLSRAKCHTPTLPLPLLPAFVPLLMPCPSWKAHLCLTFVSRIFTRGPYSLY